jgi:HEAT repeat protein
MGLETTFWVLAETPNEAAVPVLLSALQSPHEEIRNHALSVLATRRFPRGPREIVRRLAKFDDRAIALLRRRAQGLLPVLREGLKSDDGRIRDQACRAALALRAYDLAPVLVAIAENRPSRRTAGPTQVLIELAEILSRELAGELADAPRDPLIHRRRMLPALEASLARYDEHRRREIVEVFLTVVGRENPFLRLVLSEPRHPAHRDVVELMAYSGKPGIVRLLVSFIEDANGPCSVIKILSERCDREFLRKLDAKIAEPGATPSPAIAATLHRIVALPWLHAGGAEPEHLSDDLQAVVVRLVAASGMPRTDVLDVIHEILDHGGVEGRRAASQALADFQGDFADQLAIKALQDDDAEVVANSLSQLREREINGALSTLFSMLDNPDDTVREAARTNLHEFNFARYLRVFDALDEDIRRRTGELVRKVDMDTIPTLQREMKSAIRTRRLRALRVATAIAVVEEIEGDLIERLADSDHVVRASAARALGQSGSAAARRALREALSDSSVIVQEAAEESLSRPSEQKQYI